MNKQIDYLASEAGIHNTVSKRINSIRFLLIVCIIVKHSTLERAIIDGVRQTFEIPIVADFVITTLADVITATAVPLLFFISSYLLYQKETKFVTVFKKKSKSILVPYFIWCTLALLMYYFCQSFDALRPFFGKHVVRDFTLLDYVFAYTGDITSLGKDSAPIAAQMWFIRDLFILNLLFIPIKKVIDKFPLSVLIALFIWWISFQNYPNIYIVTPEALLFFCIGYYAVKYSLDINKIDAIRTLDLAIIYTITIIVENFFIDKVPIIHKINIIIGVIFFMKLSKYLVSKPQFYSYLLRLNVYAFFIYASHEAIITGLKKASMRIFPVSNGWLLFQFFALIIIGLSVTLSAGIFIRKYFPKMYAVLTGGRVYK